MITCQNSYPPFLLLNSLYLIYHVFRFSRSYKFYLRLQTLLIQVHSLTSRTMPYKMLPNDERKPLYRDFFFSIFHAPEFMILGFEKENISFPFFLADALHSFLQREHKWDIFNTKYYVKKLITLF